MKAPTVYHQEHGSGKIQHVHFNAQGRPTAIRVKFDRTGRDFTYDYPAAFDRHILRLDCGREQLRRFISNKHTAWAKSIEGSHSHTGQEQNAEKVVAKPKYKKPKAQKAQHADSPVTQLDKRRVSQESMACCLNRLVEASCKGGMSCSFAQITVEKDPDIGATARKIGITIRLGESNPVGQMACIESLDEKGQSVFSGLCVMDDFRRGEWWTLDRPDESNTACVRALIHVCKRQTLDDSYKAKKSIARARALGGNSPTGNSPSETPTPPAPLQVSAGWIAPPLSRPYVEYANSRALYRKLQTLQGLRDTNRARVVKYETTAHAEASSPVIGTRKDVTITFRSKEAYTLGSIHYLLPIGATDNMSLEDLCIIQNRDARWQKAAYPSPTLCDLVRSIAAAARTEAEPTVQTRPSSHGIASRPPATGTTSPSPDPTNKHTIGVHTLVVRCNYGDHDKHGHTLVRVMALVNVLPRHFGNVQPVEIRAYWCPKCDQYYLLEDDWLALKRRGIVCCRVVEKSVYDRSWEPASGLQLAPESELHSYGYNVRADNGLTASDRQDILAFLIENRVMTPQEVARHLEWCINFMGQSERNAAARKKWQEDLEYVRNYRRPMRTVRVEAIYNTLR